MDNDKTTQAVRTSAERISTEARRQRRDINGTTKHLHLDPRIVEELKKEGHLCWVNDDLKGHLHYLEEIGYRYVTNREAYGDRKDLDPEGKVVVRYGTADDKNNPQDIYLMVQPWMFYEEDMASLDASNNKLDRLIETGENDVTKSTGRTIEYLTHKNDKR